MGRATKFQVRLADSPRTIPATLVGTYPSDDLAVIKLDQPPASLHPAHFGDSTKLQVGEIVMAMGNPLGLTGSVTNGIISATGRTVTEPAGEGPGATVPDVIQTSAAINPGNSGGALVDLAGNVIGIPTLGALEPQTNGGGGVLRVNPGGPAAAAGIQVGEVITAVNHTPVRRASDLAQVLANLDPGQSVPLSLTTTQGSQRTVMVTLGQVAGS